MESNHTPSPWYVAKTSNDQGLVISEVTGANIAVTYDKKDAPLIAAAPELLKALTELTDYIKRSPALKPAFDNPWTHACGYFNNATRAIAAAKPQ